MNKASMTSGTISSCIEYVQLGQERQRWDEKNIRKEKYLKEI